MFVGLPDHIRSVALRLDEVPSPGLEGPNPPRVEALAVAGVRHCAKRAGLLVSAPFIG